MLKVGARLSLPSPATSHAGVKEDVRGVALTAHPVSLPRASAVLPDAGNRKCKRLPEGSQCVVIAG